MIFLIEDDCVDHIFICGIHALKSRLGRDYYCALCANKR